MKYQVGIIDYGVGNIFSLVRSFEYIGINAKLIKTPEMMGESERIILPGVGAFSDARTKLTESGMEEELLKDAKEGKPLLGICLGMQLLFEKSMEYGEHKGLGIVSGYIEDMKKLLNNPNLKIPQIGWNALFFPKEEKSELFKYIKRGDYVYFVHSYSAVNCEDSLIAYTDYSYPVTAAVAKDNVYGVQFHPEKSGEVGLNILRAFCEI